MLVFFLSISGSYLRAQETTTQSNAPITTPARYVPDTAWNRLNADKAFSYRTEIEAAQKTAKPKKPPKFFEYLGKALVAIFAFFASLAGKILLWALLLGVLGFVLYKIFTGSGKFSFRREKELAESEGDSTDSLERTNWELLMQKALDEGQMRQAVRYGYLNLLQLLQEKGLIQYQNEKTNNDYYYELIQTPYKQPFRQLSRQYEYAWYGDRPLSDGALEQYLAAYQLFTNKLKAS